MENYQGSHQRSLLHLHPNTPPLQTSPLQLALHPRSPPLLFPRGGGIPPNRPTILNRLSHKLFPFNPVALLQCKERSTQLPPPPHKQRLQLPQHWWQPRDFLLNLGAFRGGVVPHPLPCLTQAQGVLETQRLGAVQCPRSVKHTPRARLPRRGLSARRRGSTGHTLRVPLPQLVVAVGRAKPFLVKSAHSD